MSEERFYAEVAQELQLHGPQPGLWAKAYAEAEGIEAKAKALYLRYRVQQLEYAETERERAALALEKARQAELAEAAELARRERAAAEGITPIHRVLLGLVVFFILLSLYRAFGA